MRGPSATNFGRVLLSGAIVLLLGLSFPLAAGAQDAPTTTPAAVGSPIPGDAAPPDSAVRSRAVIIPLEGVIDDFNRDSLFKRFEQARELGADTIILKLNTPGGLVTSGLDISRFLKRQDDLHVIAYVEEQALSAGIMIGLAADEIVMQPGSMIGDSAPIAMAPGGGLQTLEGAERAKAESPILADFYDSAIENDYPPILAEAMVAFGRVVHYIEHPETGERQFVDAAGYEELVGEGDWQPVEGVRNPVDGAESLLTVTTNEAVVLGLATGTAASAEALAQDRGLAVLALLEQSGGEKFIGLLSSAAARALLMTVLMLSLYMAFGTPGQGAPEAVALVCLGLLIGVPLLTGHAQWWEIVAVIAGLVLIAVEIFILPGFGVAGITGVLLMLFGLTMTWVGDEPVEMPGFVLPALGGTWSALKTSLYVVTGGLLASLFLWIWLSRYLPKLPYANRLILTTTAGGGSAVDAGNGVATTAEDVAPEMPVVGEYGEAMTDLRPGGMARFEGTSRIADVVAEGGYVPRGTRLVVREVAGSRVLVRPVPAADTGPAPTTTA